MIAYHCDTNLILELPLKTRKYTHRLKAYDKIMQCISNHKMNVDIQILDNEASAEYKRFIKKNGTVITNWCPLTLIEATQQNEPFARSNHTSSPYLSALLLISQEIYGTSYSLRRK